MRGQNLRQVGGTLGTEGPLERADPEVAKPHRISRIRQRRRAFGGEAVDRRGRGGGPLDRDLILDQHAIVQHGEGTGLDRAIRQLRGRMKSDGVGLPLAGFSFSGLPAESQSNHLRASRPCQLWVQGSGPLLSTTRASASRRQRSGFWFSSERYRAGNSPTLTRASSESGTRP